MLVYHSSVDMHFHIIIILFFEQVALTGTQIWWTTEVNLSFTRLEEGYENALKDYYRKQVLYICKAPRLSISMNTIHYLGYMYTMGIPIVELFLVKVSKNWTG